MIALTGIDLYTPRHVIRDAVLLTEGEKIAAVGSAEEVPIPPGAEVFPLPGKKVFPGFIDVHTHGLLGMDTMSADLAGVIRQFPRFGVTSFMATTITLPLGEIFPRLRIMAEILDNPPAGANCLGIHLEGPHLSTRRPGMAEAGWFHALTRDEFDSLQQAAGGHIRMITFAPEDGEAMDLIPYLIGQKVVPVLGHSDATYEQVEAAVALGLAHATHTFNAMNPFHHRAPGVIGAVMALDPLIAELIADGHHVHPGAMKALLNAKGSEGVCLVSDSAPFAALPDGEYTWKEYTLVIQDGTCRLPDGTLAGAHALMDSGFRNLVRLAGLSLSQAGVCASEVPARSLGLEKRKGLLLPGYDADLVVMDESLSPCLTMVGGQIAFSML